MTSQEILTGIALIVLIGVLAQWLAARVGVPSILLLLGAGLIAGPATGLLDPDELFGDLLFPMVSLSVALILFEGSMTLNFRELRGIGGAVFNLVTIGAAITWVLSSAGAYYILGLSAEISILLGAILTVSGPTVVMPLLLHVRPIGRVGPVLKWEGIFIDPVGAILAVIVMQTILAGNLRDGVFQLEVLFEVLFTLAVGTVIGLAVAALMTFILKNRLVPDAFENPLILATVLSAFALSNALREESGLMTVVVMGLAMANQRYASTHHIETFKENLRVLILALLFIVLAARLDRSYISELANFRSLAFLILLIGIVRPIGVLASTFRSRLTWNERAFLAWLMPRGIVAASVGSVFGIELAEQGIADADLLAPYVFLVIIGTVLVYGLTALPVAQRLGLAASSPQGVLFIGAHPLAQELALALQQEGIRVLLVDTNRTNIQGARLAGLPTYFGNIMSEHAIEDMDLSGIGKLLAVTPNDEVNALAAVRMAEIFERRNVYQLAGRRSRQEPRRDSPPPQHLRGRVVSNPRVSFDYLTQRFRDGAQVKRTVLTENYGFDQFRNHYGDDALPLFRINSEGAMRVFTPDQRFEPQTGDTIISVVDPLDEPVRSSLQISPDRVLTADEMERAGLTSSYCDWQASMQQYGGTTKKPEPRVVERTDD